jgi:hypothetical protein
MDFFGVGGGCLFAFFSFPYFTRGSFVCLFFYIFSVVLIIL